jgi:hypothetical protein
MLCKSLGFIAKLIITNYNEYEINLVGHRLDEIPTNIPIKNCISKDTNDKFLNSLIEINPIGRSTYYGWRIDGNKRFLLKDFTVAHNCDQMWCSVCFTPFSWTSGKKVTGVIHNPHYYEWQRQRNNGVAPRVEGDIVCGGLPDIGVFDRHLLQENISSRTISQKSINDRHRIINHILHVDMHHYNIVAGEMYEQLRLKFLLKQITEKEWSTSIQKNEKKNEKNHAVVQVLRMFTTIMTDMFNNILTKKNEEITNTWEEMEKLRNYTNENLLKIYNRFNNVTPYITINWESVSITLKDKLDKIVNDHIWNNIYEIPIATNRTRLDTDEDSNLILGPIKLCGQGYCLTNIISIDFVADKPIEVTYISFKISPDQKLLGGGDYEVHVCTEIEDTLGKDINFSLDKFIIGRRVYDKTTKQLATILDIQLDDKYKIVYDTSKVGIINKSNLSISLEQRIPLSKALITENIIKFNINSQNDNTFIQCKHIFETPIIIQPGQIISIVNKHGPLNFTWEPNWNRTDPVKFRYFFAFNFAENIGDIVPRVQETIDTRPGFYFGAKYLN